MEGRASVADTYVPLLLFQEFSMPGYMKGKAKAASYDSFSKSMTKGGKKKRQMKTKTTMHKSKHGTHGSYAA